MSKHSLILKYLLSSNDEAGSWTIEMNKTKSCPHRAYILEEKKENKKVNK